MLLPLVSGVHVYLSDMLVPDAESTICIAGHREKNIPSYEGYSVYRNITVQPVRLMLYRCTIYYSTNKKICKKICKDFSTDC